MPNLAEEQGALAVDSVNDGFPGFHLLLRPDAGGLGVPLGGDGDVRGLGDEEATLGRPLRVVQHGVRLRHAAVGAAPRERREHHPVREVEPAHLVRRQQRDRLLRHHLVLHRNH